ncbi:MAG: hypothetical protein M1834_008932 [Cirrosporium novae-zelandiae]|nr:MAG: hypothetical protein M1834_008932 [Cirrosporium novae-zelandiae]
MSRSSPASGLNIKQFGLSEVYRPEHPLVDVVFVHGLNGHPEKTWSTKDTFWPKDLLPIAVEDTRARVLMYGYDANVTAFTDGTSKDRIHNHAEHLVASLYANRSLRERPKATERPIIFVCHSLGGLVVKRALIYSSGLHVKTAHLRSIYLSTYGILFLGTPHKGSDMAKWGAMLESICRVSMPTSLVHSQPQLLEALKSNNETLQNIDRLFVDMMSRYHIFFFHEAKPSSLKIGKKFIVEEDSAAPTLEGVERMGIEADHSHMCKFDDVDSPGYEAVAEAIVRYAEAAPSVIARRWREEQKRRSDMAKAAAMEALGIDVTDHQSASEAAPTPWNISEPGTTGKKRRPTLPAPDHRNDLDQYEVEEPEPEFTIASIEPDPLTSAPLLVAPDGFRPNDVFFGMNRELAKLHKKIFTLRKREVGTCAVLIWSRTGAGSGKTHLARQYVFTHRMDFPTGTFWVNARTRESLYKSYWDIAQQTTFQDLRSSPSGTNQQIATNFIETTKKWFESRDNWLLVIDGISLETDKDVALLQRFLPDSKNSSLIYTSRDRSLAGMHRLLNPLAVNVKPLGIEDARALLFHGLGLKHPNQEHIKKATEIVQYVECLPLAIHAIAHRLNATRRPLEKFNILSYSTDARLAVLYQGIMQDLWSSGHYEAQSLIHLLSFYDHEVPVAMLQLGKRALKDLEIDIRSTEHGGLHKDMETTFAILIKYGLIDRTAMKYETPDRSATGSSLHQSLDNSSTASVTRTIDILKTHSVVQGFFLDSLKASGNFYEWLKIATRVFCRSFQKATLDIEERGGSGLVKDYREYEIHGGRLMSHYPKSAKVILKEDLREYQTRLEAVMHKISEEISRETPHSSQENVRSQTSVFDRTSSISTGGPDTPDNIKHLWDSTPIFDADMVQVDSPGSTIDLEHSINRGKFLTAPVNEDKGYESEWDVPSEKGGKESLSNSISEDLKRYWLQRSRQPKDLGSFRPSPLNTQVTKTVASGVLNRSQSEPTQGVSGISPAETVLAAMRHASPPPTRGGRKVSPGSHGAMGSIRPLGISSPLKEELEASDPALRNARNKSSPALTQIAPTHHSSPNFRPLDIYPTSALPEVLISDDQPHYFHHIRHASHPPQPPLPIETNISISRRPRSFSNFNSQQYPYPPVTTAGVPIQNLNQTVMNTHPLPFVMPSGYTSQPMSRDPSGDQARFSLPQSEPYPFPQNLGSPPNLSIPHVMNSRESSHLTFAIGDWTDTPSSGGVAMSRDNSGSGSGYSNAELDQRGRVGRPTRHSIIEAQERQQRDAFRQQHSQGTIGIAGQAPYPNINMIPTETDPLALEALQRELSPEGERNGLGINISDSRLGSA